jgi:Ca2+-dependent lipid-binding protein
LKPSVRWVQAGSGTMGTVYLEIVGCNNLPNLDLSNFDLTDPFVGIVFEDTFVRTDIIWDELNPRWMPWTTRAFAFQVRHPSSILMLGVFDHDETPSHDPAGRVVINTANFESDTTYLLHYQLRHDPRQEDNVSTKGRLVHVE